MGAEHSTSERKKREEEQNQKMIHGILAQQRRAYEEKCREMLQQQQSVTVIKVTKGSSLQATKPNTQSTTNSYSPLYPNLQVPQNVSIQPSTSRVSYNTSTTSNIQMNMQANAPSKPDHNTTYYIGPTSATAVSTSKAASALTPSCFPSASVASTSNEVSAFTPSCPPSEPAAPTSDTPIKLRPRSSTHVIAKSNTNQAQGLCSTCGDSLGVKIYQCGLGHSSCMVCKFKECNCGICRNPITDTRNITLESYLADLQINTSERAVNCPNKSDGCRLSFKQNNLDAHLKECLYREMACPVAFLNYNRCTWRGKVNQIQAHFLDCHPNQTGAEVDTEMTFNPQIKSHIVNHVSLGKFNFLVHLKTDSQFMYCSVQLIGPRFSASKWTYELHIYNKSEPRRKYMYQDTCSPDSDTFTDICKESNCSVLPLAYVISYVNDNNLTYKFYIKKGNETETKRTDTPNPRGRDTSNQRGRGRRPHNKKSNT